MMDRLRRVRLLEAPPEYGQPTTNSKVNPFQSKDMKEGTAVTLNHQKKKVVTEFYLLNSVRDQKDILSTSPNNERHPLPLMKHTRKTIPKH